MSVNHILLDGLKFDPATGELINEVEQVEVEIVEDSLPAIVCNGGTHIQTNTEQLKRELTIYLSKYDIEVTEDTEKEASKKATELNKLAKDLNDKRLEVSKEIKKPADTLKTSIDELIALVQEKRNDILENVNVFKEKRFEIIRSLLKAKLHTLYLEMNVSELYQVVDVESLVKETSLGKTNLSKAAIESLESMVRKVKALEDAVMIRTLQLDMICRDGGLDFPIEIDEVSSIIEDDDYSQKLDDMIKARFEMQEKIKQKAIQDAENKERMLLEQEAQKARYVEQIKEKEIESEKEKIEKIQEATGKKIVTLVATFQIEVDLHVTENSVWAKYTNKLTKDFTTLKRLDIQELV